VQTGNANEKLSALSGQWYFEMMSAVTPLSSAVSNSVWLTARRTSIASSIFSGSIDVHPVLVRDTMHRLPFSLIPQIAFVGRSNVGKSSLINSLVHGREIARPSPLPGRTRQLFTFDVADAISLVDLPGYGFAGKISKTDRDEWLEMIKLYIANANGLERVVSLLDCRQGIKKIDEEFWKIVSGSPIHPKRRNKAQIMVTLTKTDLIDSHDLSKVIKGTAALVDHYRRTQGLRVWPYLHAVSSETGFGVKELRSAISSMCPIPGEEENNSMIA
jgi:ribosome biogenesis GTP-binding protein YsxC/EngB